MASTSEITPRRNPRRSCARQEPWKFDDDNDETIFVNDDDIDDFDFRIYHSTPLSGQNSPSSHNSGQRNNSTPTRRPNRFNKFIVDYDPDNDVFIHDVIRVNFNADKLKNHIKQFMKTSGVPAYKRAINNSIKKSCMNRRPYRKRNPNLVKKRKPREEEIDPSLQELLEMDETPSYPQKPTPESTLRAMIYARDFLNRLAEKRKNAEAAAAAAIENQKSRSDRKIVESEILKGVVAYVDVISHEDEDISSVIKKELEKLGAVVVSTLTKNDPVSIILFNDGHVSTYQKAKKRGIPLVSVLWIEECRRTGTQASASQFPANKMERYESPAFIKELKKRKFVYGSERMNPRKQRKRRGQETENTLIETPEPESRSTASCEFTPKSDPPAPAWLNEIQGSNGMMRILVNMTGVTEDQFQEMMDEPDGSEKYEASPLPVRLLHKLAKESSYKSTATKNESTPSSSKIESDSEQNIKSDTGSIIATSLTKQPCVTTDKKSNTRDGKTKGKKVKIEENLTPVPTRRVSTRPRAVRRRLAY